MNTLTELTPPPSPQPSFFILPFSSKVVTSNQSNPLVSIIIPVYNVEKYIAECLDSLINQTFTDIEIICIDDGSTDNSRAIIIDYMNKDPRIHLITQENSGPSSARNKGIEYSKAPYILFCDPDDYYAHNAIELLYTAMSRYSPDIVSGKVYFHDQRKSKRGKIKDAQSLIPPVKGLFRVTQRDFRPAYWSQCGKLFKRSLIEKFNITFPIHILYGEDLYFSYTYLAISKNIYYVQEPIYYYRLRKGSATYVASQAPTLPFIAMHPLEAIESIFHFTKSHNCLYKYAEALCEVYLDCFSFSLTKTSSSQISELYSRASSFWDMMEESLQYCIDTLILREITAIRQGAVIHGILVENKILKKDINKLYKRSLTFKIKYAKYYLLSKFPSKKRRQYKNKYSKLKSL